MRMAHFRPASSTSTALASLALTLALLLTACGDDGTDDAATTTSSAAEPASTSSASTSSTVTTGSSSTTGDATSSPTTGFELHHGDGATSLPGEPIFSIPQNGDLLGVIGVAHDDVLNVRAVPGSDTEIVATAGPTTADLEATGEARKLPSTIWYQVRFDGVTGWVNSSFVAFIGGTDDATAEFLAGDDLPQVETMIELGELVADGFATTDPESRVVLTVAPSVGDLGEVTYDVIGVGDDALRGHRLHIFATPAEGGEGFVLKSIERTFLCARGSSTGLCP